MFSAKDLNTIKQPQFFQRVNYPLNQLVKPIKTVKLQQIWTLPAKQVESILASQKITSKGDNIVDRLTVARLYADEGKLSVEDTQLVRQANFEKLIPKSVNWNKTYSTMKKKTLLNQMLPNELSTLIGEYDELPIKTDYMFIVGNNI